MQNDANVDCLWHTSDCKDSSSASHQTHEHLWFGNAAQPCLHRQGHIGHISKDLRHGGDVATLIFPSGLQLYAEVKALSVCENKNTNNPVCTGTVHGLKSLSPLVYERLSVWLHFSVKVLPCQTIRTNDNESRMISCIEK